METIPAELFTLHADFCKIMGNPKRLMIIAALGEGELSVGEIASIVEVPMTNASQHLSTMKAANLVVSRKEGQTVLYRLTDPRITEACEIIRSVLLSFMKQSGSIASKMDRRSKIS